MWAPWPNGQIAVIQAPGQAPSACGRLVLESSWPTSSAPFTLSTDGATAKRSPPLPSKPPKSPEQIQAWGCISTTPSCLSGWGTASGGTWLNAVMRRGPSGLEVSPMGSWRSCGLMPLWCSVRRLANRLAGQPWQDWPFGISSGADATRSYRPSRTFSPSSTAMTFCNSSSIRLRSAAADSSLPFFDCCSRFSHARANASACRLRALPLSE